MHDLLSRLADLLPATSRDQFDGFIDMVDAASLVNNEAHHVVDHLGQRQPVSFHPNSEALVVDSTRIHLDDAAAEHEGGRLVLDDGVRTLTIVADATFGVRVGEYGILVAQRDGRGRTLEDALTSLAR